MMQKFLMMSMGVRPTAGAGPAGDVRRRPADRACSGEDTGDPPRLTKAAASMVACRGDCLVPSPAPGRCDGIWGRCRARQLLLSSAQRLAIADLRLAAWFLWMTPLLAALSRLCDAVRMATVAASTSPASAASRNLRTAVFSDDLTALLRCRAFSFCLLRLIWDLIFATRKPRSGSGLVGWGAGGFRTHGSPPNSSAAKRGAQQSDGEGYPNLRAALKPAAAPARPGKLPRPGWAP